MGTTCGLHWPELLCPAAGSCSSHAVAAPDSSQVIPFPHATHQYNTSSRCACADPEAGPALIATGHNVRSVLVVSMFEYHHLFAATVRAGTSSSTWVTPKAASTLAPVSARS